MFRKIIISIVGVLILFLGSSFIPLGSVDPNPEMDIYLVSNDIHIGIMVPRKHSLMDWDRFLGDVFKAKDPNLEWVDFGWGDRRFYFEMPAMENFTWELAADALFLPDPAVLHVGISEKLAEGKYVRKVRISQKTYQKLVASIKSWFVTKDQKPILIPGKGYTDSDVFFEAKGSYSIVNTCNVWTSSVLADADLKHPLWSPTKYGLEFLWSPE